MAWDPTRPYAPFSKHPKSSPAYAKGERECMESYAAYTPDERDIDRIWGGDGSGVTYAELTHSNGWKGLEFRPFKDVELTLVYDGYARGQSAVTFRWRDEHGTPYPMFANELDRLLQRELLKKRMHATWSAEKKGSNYGIRLVKVLDD